MIKIGIIGQKGGTGKSTLARLISVNFALNQWRVKLADMDTKQGTSIRWNARRMQNGFVPEISVEQFSTVAGAVRGASGFDSLVFDGSPHSHSQTLEIARLSDFIFFTTGTAIDDLEPGVSLAKELIGKGIPKNKMYFAFCRVGSSLAELNESKDILNRGGFQYLNGVLYEKTTVRRAHDNGQCAIETPYKSVNESNDIMMEHFSKLIELWQNQ